MNGRAQDEMLAEECGLNYDEVMADNSTVTEYDIWYQENESNILIELAENGADREMDFDLEAEFDKRYQRYLDSK